MFRAFMLTREEWKEGTAPFLRSLPISGWSIVGAKLLAAFTEWLFLSFATVYIFRIVLCDRAIMGVEWPALPDLVFLRTNGPIYSCLWVKLCIGDNLDGAYFSIGLFARTDG